MNPKYNPEKLPEYISITLSEISKGARTSRSIHKKLDIYSGEFEKYIVPHLKNMGLIEQQCAVSRFELGCMCTKKSYGKTPTSKYEYIFKPIGEHEAKTIEQILPNLNIDIGKEKMNEIIQGALDYSASGIEEPKIECEDLFDIIKSEREILR